MPYLLRKYTEKANQMNGIIFFEFVISWKRIRGQRKRSLLHYSVQVEKVKKKNLGLDFFSVKFHCFFNEIITFMAL